MPTWGEILQELNAAIAKGEPAPLDLVRRRYLAEAHTRTKRNVILYATKWTQGPVDPSAVSITYEDVQALMEVVHGLRGDKLDLILHSPGGSADAAEAVVAYLHSKFSHIRVIVPQMAMSAATMIACAADSIMMGKHSFLGPIDPQIITGGRPVPAQAILAQFERAQEECKDAKKMGAWIPILPQYGPALLVECVFARELAETLVKEWLTKYMFANARDAQEKASKIASFLADHTYFKSHGRPITRDLAREKGLLIEDLEKDQAVQDAFLSVFHATTHTFNASAVVKIVENHLGKAFIKAAGQVTIQLPGPPPTPTPPAP